MNAETRPAFVPTPDPFSGLDPGPAFVPSAEMLRPVFVPTFYISA